MSHPYKHLREKHPGRGRVHKVFGKFAKGGAVHEDEAEDRKLIRKELAKHDHEMKATGSKGKARFDKHARGGKVKSKGHHTKINIVVAPKGGADVPPPVAAPPAIGPGAGAPPMMPPKAPMAPPPGPAAGGMPGIGMKRGGGVKPQSGISSPDNLKKWANYASRGTKYASGGKVPMTAGSLTGEGRLEKKRLYGKNARKNG